MGSLSSCRYAPQRLGFASRLLAFFWIIGLVLGSFLGAGDSLFSLMRRAPAGTVSIVSLLFMTLLPFLFSALAVLISPSLLYPVCFGKAFVSAFLAVGLSRAFGIGGWLVRLLVLFSSCVTLPLLYFLWLRLLHGRPGRWELALILALAVLVCSVDDRIVSPVLAWLIKN